MSWKHANAARAAKTHCKHGHKFTKKTTRIYNGKRACMRCIAARQRGEYEPRGFPRAFVWVA